MGKIILSVVLAIGILTAIDHYFYFDRYTDAAILFLHEIRRALGW